MKNDLKVEMAPAGSPEERLDRTISYVNGSLSNAELVTLAQQFVGLTTNTYLGGEKIERVDISSPDVVSTIIIDTSHYTAETPVKVKDMDGFKRIGFGIEDGSGNFSYGYIDVSIG